MQNEAEPKQLKPVSIIARRKRAKERLLEPQLIADRRFMTRPQREAHAKGIEIWR